MRGNYLTIELCLSVLSIVVSCNIFLFAFSEVNLDLLNDLIATKRPVKVCKAKLTFPNAPLPSNYN
jgi:hypothetical protein